MTAADIARHLAARTEALCTDLLPAGHREGVEWRCGSITGESGHSLGVHLCGPKAGRWADFAAEQHGDALDLVRAVMRLDTAEAIEWSRRWLGIAEGAAELPVAPLVPSAISGPSEDDPGRWRRPWEAAQPITGTVAERYLTGRGLAYDDPHGAALRFAPRRWRRPPDSDVLEHHPALLALLRDIRSGERCGVVNVFLRPDGSDRVRDGKGKTTTGRAAGAAVMLSAFDDVTMGLVLCEGAETGIALLMAGLAPVWALGGAGNLAAFPVLAGIEAVTIAADADEPGRRAAAAVAGRWRQAGREAEIILPPAGDWADDCAEAAA